MEITEADVNRPLAELVENSKEKVIIEDIAEYSEIFFSIEYIVLNFWQKKPALKDKTVLSAYHKLKKDFDGQKKGSLADEISKSVKALLVLNKIDGERSYTYEEIISCVKYLIKLVNQHRSPSRIGYLQWIKTFFEGNLPQTDKEISDYIDEYES
ncbi:MAG: hypothetical protein HF976_00620 [ANME-2 cluster archaeon]|nr:hypothetical protein [ANME-2 cluster archaeon]MBC2699920.1 hypothetical protein [ANME-2 cluster archaeon]MBC2706231.1 hypothetical protein [ANME-2 cluster archaeon]MBC2748070.1 hypothetical protein [ANME-2 cluster archaeon]MBC2762462.1 hypothetical protein [ANME-2 cluster archaeon]